MRYLSLFSGIGGFEVAIHHVFGNKAECVGYSEIDNHAISEYTRHYPSHVNLGDITQIRKKDIDKLGNIDLVVGGFPCSDLSSLKTRGRQGLYGAKSGLFWTMLQILKWVRKNNEHVQIIIENNVSMAHKWRDIITEELSKVFHIDVFCNLIDSSRWVIQRRRRYYWTLKKIPDYDGPRIQSFDDVLLPIEQARKYQVSEKMIAYLNHSPKYLEGSTNGTVMIKIKEGLYTKKKVTYPTRFRGRVSSTQEPYIRCVDTGQQFILDYRFSSKKDVFLPRYLAKEELNALFGHYYDYILSCSNKIYSRLYGMTVIPQVIIFIIRSLFRVIDTP